MKKYLILTGVFALLFGGSFAAKQFIFNEDDYTVKESNFVVQEEVVPYGNVLTQNEILTGYYFTDKKPFYLDDRIYIDSIGVKASNLEFYKNPYKSNDLDGNPLETYFYSLDFEVLNYLENSISLSEKAVSLHVETEQKTVQIYASELFSETKTLDGSFIFGDIKSLSSRYGKIFFKLSEEEFEAAESIKLQVIVDGSPVFYKVK